jgi:dienelactone hydrolase
VVTDQKELAKGNTAMARKRASEFSNDGKFSAYSYERANHGFNNDTTPRFDEDLAAVAWRRTLAFFSQQLR